MFIFKGDFMKKILAVVFATAVMFAGVFADEAAIAEAATTFAVDTTKSAVDYAVDATGDALKDVEFPTGTWIDENWNAHWVMDVAKVHLYDAVTGKKIFTFTKNNTENFKFTPSADGVSLSFKCEETNRFYKFTKPFSLDKDLEMFIDPNWTDKDYNVTLKFKSVDMPQ